MKVEIWSDIICPWCYIGKRRFERAMSTFPHAEQVEIVWRSFELDPGAPQEHDLSLDRLLAEKYGVGLEQAKAMNAHVSHVAASEDLDYRLDEARRGNTFDAHRLLHFAATRALRPQLKERLLHAYFSEGAPIGDHDILAALAADVGLDRDEATSVLAEDSFADGVRGDEERARAIGCNGVPFFAFDERYGVSGAQPSELFLEVLEKVWETSQPAYIGSGRQAR